MLDVVLIVYILLGLSYAGGVISAGSIAAIRTNSCRVGRRHTGRRSEHTKHTTGFTKSYLAYKTLNDFPVKKY
jgi:hypothetical protein